MRIDYIPRHFDPAALSRGNYAELLNLVAWKVTYRFMELFPFLITIIVLLLLMSNRAHVHQDVDLILRENS